MFFSPAISPDGKTLYLSADDGTLAIVDLVAHAVTYTTNLGGGGMPIALSSGSYLVAIPGAARLFDATHTQSFYVPQTTNTCAAIAKDGTIVTAQAGNIIGVQPPPKSIVWTAPTPGDITSCLVIDGNGIVYGITSTSIVVAIDPTSPSSPRWTLPVPRATDLIVAREKTILVVTDLGEVIALR
jgi:hypothetical protein